MDFLCIDFGKDSIKAHKFVVEILQGSFNVDEKLFAQLENAACEDRLIDNLVT